MGIAKLHETTVARLLWYAAIGEAEEARQYAGHVLKRGAPLDPVRQSLAGMIGADFYDATLAAIPWLEDETFGEPRRVTAAGVSAAPADRIVAMLTEAGRDGMTKTRMRTKFADRVAFDTAIDDLDARGVIRWTAMSTRGRPALTYWLADLAPVATAGIGQTLNIDPFAYAQDAVRRTEG